MQPAQSGRATPSVDTDVATQESSVAGRATSRVRTATTAAVNNAGTVSKSPGGSKGGPTPTE